MTTKSVVVSTINLKGGVGKTQMTVALAEFLALEYDKKVLVIDLDPQTNATVSLIGEDKWLDKEKKNETILQLFKDKLNNTNLFNINKAIEKGVSNIGEGIKNLDLLPSSLGLIDVQDELLTIGSKSGDPTMVLKREMEKIKENKYDYILIDCPPNLGIITKNGLAISDYYLTPCIPDILSTYGIPTILKQVENFKKTRGIEIKPLGVVVSMYRAQTKLHKTVRDLLEEKTKIPDVEIKYPKIFKATIPLAIKAAEAAEFDVSVNTLKQKYGYGGLYESYSELTKEVFGL